MSSKILVVGSINGQFREVFKKISALHAKNNFSLAIVAGDLFTSPLLASPQDETDISDLLNDKIEVPLSTYFALGTNPLPPTVVDKLETSDGEVCPNLHFLGKRSIIKTSEGIRIVALGGSLDASITAGASKDRYPPYYGEDDAKVLRGANTADLLITSEWPTGITTGSKVDALAKPAERQCIADLCATLKPRYHFSVSEDSFYEREPFFHPPSEDADGFQLTRFISLARFNNPKKQKWIYAFTLDPSTSVVPTVPAGATASPFTSVPKKRPAPSNDAPSYRFSTDGGGRHRSNKRHKNKMAPPTPAECFFCLSNPNVAMQLIVSIGEEAYLTTAKGPLTTSETFPELGFPCHILVIPMTHAPTLPAIDSEETREQTYTEMQRYRAALHSMLRKRAGGKLGSVTWEVSRSGGIHIHWQFIPVDADLIQRGLVEAAFKVQAENEQYPPFSGADLNDSDYFKVMIWNPAGNDGKGSEKSISLPLDFSFRFDLQFGRKVMAKLLGLENRIQWQDCGQTPEEETADANAFKEAFKEFDFSLEG